MADGFELRRAKFHPYSQRGIYNGTSPLNGLDSVRLNAGEAGSLVIDLSIENRYIKDEGSSMKLMYLLNDSGNGFPDTARIELDSPDPEFSDRFSVGDNVFIDGKGGAFSVKGAIIYIDSQVMELELSQPVTGSVKFEQVLTREVYIINETPFESFDIKYNLAQTGKNVFANGFDGGEIILTGEPEESIYKELKPKTGGVKNWFLSNYSPLILFSGFTENWQVNTDYGNALSVQNYSLYGVPVVFPYWSELLEENYDENTKPEEFIGDSQIRLICEVTAYRKIDRSDKPFIYEFEVSSNTGWYGENGNGGESQIEFSSISYNNLIKNQPSSGLDLVDTTSFEVELNRNLNIFTSNNFVSVYVARKSTFEQYNQSKKNHDHTYVYSGARILADGVSRTSIQGIGKDEFSSLQATISNSGQTLTLLGSYQSKASTQNEVNLDDPYILIVEIWDSVNDQQVSLLVDDNTWTRFTDEEGLVELIKGRVFDPDADPLDIDNDGYSNGEFWNEDGISLGFKFRQSLASFGEIKALKMMIVSNLDSASDGITDYSNPDNYIEIQSFDIPFNNVASNSNGLPIYQGSIDRDFNLDDNDAFKFVRVSTTDNVNETEVFVNCGFKVNWQYWNQLQGVPDVFFNSADAFNGFNQRTSNYSEKPIADPFNVKAVLLIECQNRLNPFTTEYAYQIPLKVYDYGEDKYTRQSDFPDWTGEIFTEKLDGTDLGGSILTGEPTKIKVHWTNNGRVSSSLPYWFMTRIEESGQPSFDIWEISNIKYPAQNNLLSPIENEIALFIYSDGADGWFTECQTVPNRFEEGVSYKLSARIGSNESGEALGFGYSLGFTTGFNS